MSERSPTPERTAAPEGVRLQKILSRAAVASRRKAEILIREGRVTVNGSVAKLGDRADPDQDAIKVDGKRLQPIRDPRYLLLNKPRGYLSTTRDPQGRSTVLDLIPRKLRRGLHPVGRLDFNTEGLLLLTNDGAFSQRIAHPRHGCTKVYEVKVKGHPEDATLRKLREGVLLDGRRTAPCRIVARPGSRSPQSLNSWWSVTLSEGRTRQIREMFYRVGHPVQRLRRLAVGSVRDSRLALGSYRELREAEVKALLEGREASASGPRRSAPRDRAKSRRGRR